MAVQVNVTAKSSFDSKLFALNVVISVPMPDNTAKAEIQTTQGEWPSLLHVSLWLDRNSTKSGAAGITGIFSCNQSLHMSWLSSHRMVIWIDFGMISGWAPEF